MQGICSNPLWTPNPTPEPETSPVNGRPSAYLLVFATLSAMEWGWENDKRTIVRYTGGVRLSGATRGDEASRCKGR